MAWFQGSQASPDGVRAEAGGGDAAGAREAGGGDDSGGGLSPSGKPPRAVGAAGTQEEAQADQASEPNTARGQVGTQPREVVLALCRVANSGCRNGPRREASDWALPHLAGESGYVSGRFHQIPTITTEPRTLRCHSQAAPSEPASPLPAPAFLLASLILDPGGVNGQPREQQMEQLAPDCPFERIRPGGGVPCTST
jgi:hypothetical protein